MSNDQENFLGYQKNPAFSMQSVDDFYKIMNFFKYFLNGANEPKQDFFNLFLYQCQYQLQNQLYQNAIEEHQSEISVQDSTKSPSLNKTDLLKESIEKILSSNENKPNLKQKSRNECTTNELLKHQQSTYKRSVTGGNEAMSMHKMVRGQEEWVNNSRNNNFISQILKCLECSASFDTLDDLSLHMLKFNHFSRFHPNQPLLQNTRSVSPKQKAKTSISSGKLPKCLPSFSGRENSKSKNFVSTCPSVDAKDFSCKICKQNLNEESCLPPLIELIQHLKKNHKIDFICTNCGEFFYSEKDLNEHLVEFHQFSNLGQKKSKNENEKKESKTISCSSSPSSDCREKLNDPLLALQMFVNGSSNLDESLVTKNKCQNQIMNSDAFSHKLVNKQNLDAKSKLPAKKRPYFKCEEKSEENEINSEKKRLKLEEKLSESSNIKHLDSNQKSNTYQPLNLLQNMRLNIDEYFTH